ncbi:MAG: hypothetical protein CR967_04270 [Proteobacteria bacterium]|nr:MAG: hypothetical protein CR967_04270 [Pseudomonadota bacterium]
MNKDTFIKGSKVALICASSLLLGLSLTACGGNSSSDEDKTKVENTGKKPSQEQNKDQNKDQEKEQNKDKDKAQDKDKGSNNGPGDCVAEGSTVYVTAEGCTYSLPRFNGGQKMRYVCENGQVSNGIMFAPAISLNGVTFKCK